MVIPFVLDELLEIKLSLIKQGLDEPDGFFQAVELEQLNEVADDLVHVEGGVLVVDEVLVQLQLLLIYAEVVPKQDPQTLVHIDQPLLLPFEWVCNSLIVKHVREPQLQLDEYEMVNQDLVIHLVFEPVEGFDQVRDSDVDIMAKFLHQLVF